MIMALSYVLTAIPHVYNVQINYQMAVLVVILLLRGHSSIPHVCAWMDIIRILHAWPVITIVLLAHTILLRSASLAIQLTIEH